MERADVGSDVEGRRVLGEERSKTLVDVLGQEGDEGGLQNLVSKGGEGSNAGRTRVRARVKRVSKRVWRAAMVSSGEISPLSLLRLNRMYQFVSSSIKSSILLTTV